MNVSEPSSRQGRRGLHLAILACMALLCGSVTTVVGAETAGQFYQATKMKTGEVLLTCGTLSGGWMETHIWSPVRIPAIRAVSNYPHNSHSGHTCSVLPSGRVLMMGGVNTPLTTMYTIQSAVDILEPLPPDTITYWNPEGPATNAPHARTRHAAVTLLDGRVLVIGGGNNSCDIYDPGNNTWAGTGNLNVARSGVRAVLLDTGKVLVAGGDSDLTGRDASNVGINSCEIYDPQTGVWTVTGNMLTARYGHGLIALPGGRAMAMGGAANKTAVPTATMEIFTQATGSWAVGAPMAVARKHFSATMDASGCYVVVVGGQTNGGEIGTGTTGPTATTSVECYDRSVSGWSTQSPVSGARYMHAATLLDSGSILVTGGRTYATQPITSLVFVAPPAPPASWPVLTSLAVSPASVVLSASGTQAFTVSGRDQFGNAIPIGPNCMWSTSGGGSITANGVLTVDAMQTGVFTVKVNAGPAYGEAVVRVVDSVWSSLPPRTTYLVASETDYPTATTNPLESDREETQYTYEWYPSSHQIRRKTTTLPIVTAATNGPDSASTVGQIYDLAGRLLWLKDADGYVHYRAYDAFSGATTLAIDDADTTKLADFTSAPPYSTPTAATNPVAGGTHLKTTIEVDRFGRVTSETDPKQCVSYTVYMDAAQEVRVYPGWNAALNKPTGPTRMAREDWGRNYREVLTMTAVPTVASGRPLGTESVSGVQSLRREVLDGNGRVAYVDTYADLTAFTYGTGTQTLGSQRVWVAAPALPTGAYERESLTYTARGFLERRVRSDGTIEQYVRDALGRVTQRWMGTDTSTWVPGQTTDVAGFKQVADVIYDQGGVGLGQPTLHRRIGDDAAGTTRVYYDTAYWYDDRGRLIAELGPDGVLSTTTMDNLNRPLVQQRWAGIASVSATPALNTLRSQVTMSYDTLGRAWQTAVTAVQGSDGASPGTLGGTLFSQQWFDRRGYVVKSQTGTAGAFSKARYDGTGRVMYAWSGTDSSEGASWSNARTSSGDTVVESSWVSYDPASNPVAKTDFIRKDGDASTGDLTALNSHMSVSVRWLDLANRQIGTADYGRDNTATRYVWNTSGALIGSAGVPAEALNAPRLPSSSTEYRATQLEYDVAGRPWRLTNSFSQKTVTTYDAMGRVASVVDNYADGTVVATETSTDQTSVFRRSVGGGIAERRMKVATGSAVTEQVTRYLRDSTVDRSWVTSVIYPDSTETTGVGTDQVQTLYDRMGRPRMRTDQRGVVRSFIYDAAGRLASDVATTIPAGVDGAVRRLDRSYDDMGRLRSQASWNAVAGGAQLDEVRRSFDAWGNVTATAQAHDGGVVAGSTPAVTYTWNDGAVGTGPARSLRMTAVGYPSAGHGVGYSYATSGIGHAFDRAEKITSGGVDILTAEYLGLNTMARQTLPQAGGAKVERSAGGAADGYNRYWDVGNHAWVAGATQLDGWTFLYDWGGRITGRKATWTTTRTDRDDVFVYDGLNRVQSYTRGQSSVSGVLAASATRRDWTWTLDHAGNWRTYAQDTNGGAATGGTSSQARAHNLANEVDTTNAHGDAVGNSISGTGVDWIDPVYDAAGAMTTIPMPGTETSARTLTWDAWGRLVQVKNAAVSIWTARYDAAHRLIRRVDVAAAKTSDSYLDEQGRELEVRINTLLAEVYAWGVGDQMVRMGTGSGGSISTYYGVLTDQQGSPTALVQQGTSTILERYRYDAYGGKIIYAANGTTVRATSSYGMRYAFTGRPFDTVTGLGYYRYRWYHPSLGRFVSRDPAGYIDGGNLYQYVRGNPLWWTDPWGLFIKLAPSAAAQQGERMFQEQERAQNQAAYEDWRSNGGAVVEQYGATMSPEIRNGMLDLAEDTTAMYRRVNFDRLTTTREEQNRRLNIARQEQGRDLLLNGIQAAAGGALGRVMSLDALAARSYPTINNRTRRVLAAHGRMNGQRLRVPYDRRHVATSLEGESTNSAKMIDAADGTGCPDERIYESESDSPDLDLQPWSDASPMEQLNLDYMREHRIPFVSPRPGMSLRDMYDNGMIPWDTDLVLPCLSSPFER